MLTRMNDGFAWWLILVGLAIGVFVSWLLIVRIPRSEDDISPAERADEAVWISDAIENGGGIAPVSLVDEVLELHQAYLRTSGSMQAPDATLQDPAPGPAASAEGRSPPG